MNVWIDIDNAPQVQYLTPIAEAFERAGHTTIVTARDQAITLTLLKRRGRPHLPVGRGFGASRASKVTGTLRRAAALARVVRGEARPDLLISSSRSSALAGRMLGVPTFIVCDYEWVDLRFYRWCRARIVHPQVIDRAVFVSQGFAEQDLLAFEGIKEDLTFAGSPAALARPLPWAAADALRVLVRPPAAESHYYSSESGEKTEKMLRRASELPHVQLVYVPRHPRQVEQLSRFRWAREPLVIDGGVGFRDLLASVDCVVSAGGTMLREAAFLGIPAYTIFGGRLGAVDGYLIDQGRLVFVDQPEQVDFSRHALAPMRDPVGDTRVVDLLVRDVIAHATGA